MFEISERILAIDRWNNKLERALEAYRENGDSSLNEPMEKAYRKNSWFTHESSLHALSAWNKRLSQSSLSQWVGKYSHTDIKSQTVGVIMAGNVPLVGLHDLLATVLSGYRALIKMSSDDAVWMKFIVDGWIQEDDRFADIIEISDERIGGVDRIIATGSNNTARYFEYYFSKIPHIIRKNRKSIAVLNGDETEEDLRRLGSDIFTHFGLGCRNVSQLYIPKNFELDRFFKAIYDFSEVINHHKYANNYDYHKAIFLMNLDDVIENGFLILKESDTWNSPVGTLFYTRYENPQEVIQQVEQRRDQLQVAVSRDGWFPESIAFGKAQSPELTDYADGVDTMLWLREQFD